MQQRILKCLYNYIRAQQAHMTQSCLKKGPLKLFKQLIQSCCMTSQVTVFQSCFLQKLNVLLINRLRYIIDLESQMHVFFSQ